MSKVVSKYFTTNDNVELHYLEAGLGKTIIMLPGAGCSADLFKNQIDDFKKIQSHLFRQERPRLI